MQSSDAVKKKNKKSKLTFRKMNSPQVSTQHYFDAWQSAPKCWNSNHSRNKTIQAVFALAVPRGTAMHV